VTTTETGGRVAPDGIHVIPAEARPVQGRRAGIASRLLTVGIDVLVVVVLMVAAYGVWAGVLFVLRGRSFTFPTVELGVAITTGTVIFVIYCAIGWSSAGRTYGAQVLGLRVVDKRTARLRPMTSLLRAVLCVVFPVGLAWCAIDAKNRSVQDLLLGTSVVYDWEPRSATAPG
jgi:uncharacterized RDD family membrane protein YckC